MILDVRELMSVSIGLIERPFQVMGTFRMHRDREIPSGGANRPSVAADSQRYSPSQPQREPLPRRVLLTGWQAAASLDGPRTHEHVLHIGSSVKTSDSFLYHLLPLLGNGLIYYAIQLYVSFKCFGL